jgi:hypothetical protein
MITSRMPGLSAPLLRRISRVRARYSTDMQADEALDDIFVLWRALESTFDGQGTETAQAERAIVTSLTHALRFGPLRVVAPQTLAWCELLRLLHRLSIPTLAAWFNRPDLTSTSADDMLRRLAAVTRAAEAPERWHESDSRHAAWAMYSLRCAVFHASLDTHDATAERLAPAFRAALIELGMLRGAVLADVSVQESTAFFDSALIEFLADE